ncbi:DMT family transporter [Albirhodobacter sp. R86504]|jgi:drug/metabolite transporter (DMT)-like permease|uniref:DMT family transporter n=1 Tax=Albirhodobacter sp. R86504 TaxID=3093848 RepID=UPI00366C356A
MRIFLLTALTMVAFAANSVLNRMAVSTAGLDPAYVSLLRLGSGAVVLLILTLMLRGAKALRVAPRIPLIGMATLFLYVFGFSIASGLIDAGTGALTLFGSVQITMFAGALVMRERITRLRWIGAVLAFSGLFVLVAPIGTQGASVAQLSTAGIAMMVIAGIGWGLYSLNGRRAHDPLALSALNFALATVPALIWFVVANAPQQGEAWGIWPALASGAITSGLGYALWYQILPKLQASIAAVSQLTVPLLAAAGGALVLAETPDPRFWIASALVLGGIGLSLKK